MWNCVKRQITEYRFKGNKLSENKTLPAHFKDFLHSPACLPEPAPAGQTAIRRLPIAFWLSIRNWDCEAACANCFRRAQPARLWRV